jgi:hypothetical protein
MWSIFRSIRTSCSLILAKRNRADESTVIQTIVCVYECVCVCVCVCACVCVCVCVAVQYGVRVWVLLYMYVWYVYVCTWHCMCICYIILIQCNTMHRNAIHSDTIQHTALKLTLSSLSLGLFLCLCHFLFLQPYGRGGVVGRWIYLPNLFKKSAIFMILYWMFWINSRFSQSFWTDDMRAS